jgi:hypothetical protein
MSSIDALARAIKEYEGGVVIVSHDFRAFRRPSPDLLHTQRSSPGLISQVANELWEVKNRKIRNLTREDISIVDYKRMLVQNSALFSSQWAHPPANRRTQVSPRWRKQSCSAKPPQRARHKRPGQPCVCTSSLLYHVMPVVRSLCPPVQISSP